MPNDVCQCLLASASVHVGVHVLKAVCVGSSYIRLLIHSVLKKSSAEAASGAAEALAAAQACQLQTVEAAEVPTQRQGDKSIALLLQEASGAEMYGDYPRY